MPHLCHHDARTVISCCKAHTTHTPCPSATCGLRCTTCWRACCNDTSVGHMFCRNCGQQGWGHSAVGGLGKAAKNDSRRTYIQILTYMFAFCFSHVVPAMMADVETMDCRACHTPHNMESTTKNQRKPSRDLLSGLDSQAINLPWSVVRGRP